MAAAFRALGRAKLIKTNILLHPEGSRGQAQRCCSRLSMGSHCQLCRGMCWACVSAQVEMGRYLLPGRLLEALSQLVVWGSLQFSSWAGRESVGRRDGSCTTACRCVPILGGTPGHAGSRGFGGVKEAGLLAELSILTSSAGRCRASAKLLSLPKQKLGSLKLTEGSIQNKHMSSHVVSDTSGWEVVESPGHLQLPAPNTHLSSPFPIWHCHDCIGVQPRLCRPCFPPQTSLPPLPGVLEGSRVLVSHGPLHSPCSIIPFHSSLP